MNVSLLRHYHWQIIEIESRGRFNWSRNEHNGNIELSCSFVSERLSLSVVESDSIPVCGIIFLSEPDLLRVISDRCKGLWQRVEAELHRHGVPRDEKTDPIYGVSAVTRAAPAIMKLAAVERYIEERKGDE